MRTGGVCRKAVAVSSAIAFVSDRCRSHDRHDRAAYLGNPPWVVDFAD